MPRGIRRKIEDVPDGARVMMQIRCDPQLAADLKEISRRNLMDVTQIIIFATENLLEYTQRTCAQAKGTPATDGALPDLSSIATDDFPGWFFMPEEDTLEAAEDPLPSLAPDTPKHQSPTAPDA